MSNFLEDIIDDAHDRLEDTIDEVQDRIEDVVLDDDDDK